MNRFPEPVTARAGKSAAGKRKAREPQIIRQGALSPEAAPQWPIAPKGMACRRRRARRFWVSASSACSAICGAKSADWAWLRLGECLAGPQADSFQVRRGLRLAALYGQALDGCKAPGFCSSVRLAPTRRERFRNGSKSRGLETAFAPVSLGHHAMYSGANTGRCQGGRIRARVGRGSAPCGPDASGISAARRVGAAGRAFAVSGAFAAGGAAGGGAPAAQGAGAAIGRAAAGLAFI